MRRLLSLQVLAARPRVNQLPSSKKEREKTKTKPPRCKMPSRQAQRVRRLPVRSFLSPERKSARTRNNFSQVRQVHLQLEWLPKRRPLECLSPASPAKMQKSAEARN